MNANVDIVIFGGFGDLSLRKLLPAMFRLDLRGEITSPSRLFLTSISAGSGGKDNKLVREWLSKSIDDETLNCGWEKFEKRLHPLGIDASKNDEHWQNLQSMLKACPDHERIFYLAMPPALFGETCKNLAANDLINTHTRVVLEKPLGYDGLSSSAINTEVARYFDEQQIFRIDHYLGKETVQNLLALRFANELFEPLWNGRHIDHVQISVSEEVGLEGRKAFYDETGAMRDMIQNHIMQLLCLVAMEPPHKLQADNIRTEKLKVLQALRPITGREIQQDIVRGQYVAGTLNGKPVPSYRDDLGEDSLTETFVAIKAHIDNWRWSGVPFYFRTGKRMRQRCAEVVIQFKALTHNVFDTSAGHLEANRLVIRLQPQEGIQLIMMAKKMNQMEMRLQQVPLNLNFADTFQDIHTDAYQRLLLNVIHNDLSLFSHVDESKLAWAWVDPIIQSWENDEASVHAYEAGTWGPDASAALMHRDNRSWHNNGFNSNNRDSLNRIPKPRAALAES